MNEENETDDEEILEKDVEVVSSKHSRKADIEVVCKLFRGKEEGYIVTYEDISNAVSVDRESEWPLYNYLIKAARESLEAVDEMVIINERGLGYSVGNNVDKVYATQNNIKTGFNKIHKASRIAQITGDEGLSDTQIKFRDHARMLSAKLKLASNNQSTGELEVNYNKKDDPEVDKE